jgi:predicted metalloprotease with PDZ domain
MVLAPLLAGAAAAEEPGGWLGVAVVADAEAEEGGVLVAHVLPGGPAQAAGLRPDDLIRAVGDHEVTLYADLSSALADRRPGDRVLVHVLREGEELSLEVLLGERQRQALYYLEPDLLLPLERERLNEEALARSVEAMRRAVALQKELQERETARWRDARRVLSRASAYPLEPWGVELAELTPELRIHFGAPGEAGMLVSRVRRDGLAEAAGVRVGDVLVRLGERSLGDRNDLLLALGAQEESPVLPLLVARPGGTVELEIPVVELSGTLDLRDSLLLATSERERRELELRIQELETKIRELEATLLREREQDARR